MLTATVDRIEIAIRTSERTQAWRIHDAARGAISYVAGHDEETGTLFAPLVANTPTTHFRLHLQGPPNMHYVGTLLMQIGREFPMRQPPKVVALEVALDNYRKDASRRQLAEIVAGRYLFSTHAPAHDWYLYRRNGEGRRYAGTLNRASLIRHLEDGWNLTDSNDKSADARYHAYVKTHDSGEALPSKDRRARFEITLQGAALLVGTTDELERFDFARLAPYFKFRRLADDLHPAARYALTCWSVAPIQLGRRGRYRRRHPAIVGRHSGVAKFRGSTVADDVLNADTYEALRALTRRWRSRTSADFPEDSDMQIAGNPHEL